MTFPARWFFCAKGAKLFPSPHGAEASPWLKNYEVNADWGEVTPYPTDPLASASRGLDRGLNPGYPGLCFVGQPQWFVDGQLPAGILQNQPPPFPACCKPTPAASSGGVVISGVATPMTPGACQPGTGFLVRDLTLPQGQQLALTRVFPSNPLRWFGADPVYAFWWQTQRVPVPCQGFNVSDTLYATSDQGGAHLLFRAKCLGWDGFANGLWQVPFTAPFYPGGLVAMFSG